MLNRTPSSADAPQVERAYRSIKAGIVEGRYRPGSPLSEVVLAREHNMSRTPVREGLARLWQEHYLDRVVGHGYFVARVTVQSIRDTFDVLVNQVEQSKVVEDVARTIVNPAHVITRAQPQMGSEDFADMLQTIPGAYFWVGHDG